MKIRYLAPFALLLTLFACEAMQGSGGLQGALQQLTTFTGNITNWKQNLPALIGDAQLEQLGGFSKQASGLMETVKGALESADTKTQAGFTGVLESLQSMTGIDVAALKGFGNEQRQNVVNMFTGAAGTLGEQVKNLMSSGLPGLGG